MTQQPEYLSPAKLAALLDVPLKTVRDWRAQGADPPAIRVGKHIRYHRDAVTEWLASKAA